MHQYDGVMDMACDLFDQMEKVAIMEHINSWACLS